MTEKIKRNLFEFWDTIGGINDSLTETENYSVVHNKNSDWPNRIYKITDETNVLEQIISSIESDRIPPVITIDENSNLNNHITPKLEFTQTNMALETSSLTKKLFDDENMQRVISKTDCAEFAHTATLSFGYKVDSLIIGKIIKSGQIKIFNYKEKQECLGCGIIFFDSNNIAGLHMIGTIPKSRNMGVGKKITEFLLSQVIESKIKTCVLHASEAGEHIYRNYGFEGYGNLKTYII